MEQEFCEVENTDPAQHQRWLDKHGFKPDADGQFSIKTFEGKLPVTNDTLFENIRKNVSDNYYTPLFSLPYDERIFVMVCGGPSLSNHLEEIKQKTLQPEKYLVVCSNRTGDYLLKNGIVAHAHFIIDPQVKKKFDIEKGKTHKDTQYWINAACSPAVFAELKEQDIKPYIFLADFDKDGGAMAAVRESLGPGQPGMMVIQGGSMAGLRAMNLADALGHRKMEYYGFDATVEIKDGKARPYAYEKKRGEAIIEITCDRCPQKFDTTLIFQKQVNEFVQWRHNMPWLEIDILGGGLIAHYHEHLKEMDAKKNSVKYRYTPEYEAMQRALHKEGGYGVTGALFLPSIFQAICQLAKRHGKVTMLDYGSSSGKTFEKLQENFWLPPSIGYKCYDPFVDEFMADPEPADLTICTDVLEHVEPECTNAVLDHICALTKRIAFFSIALTKANKTLADGRNAHINLRDAEYWLREIRKRFITSEVKVDPHGEFVLAVGQAIEDVRETISKQKEQKSECERRAA